jgi:heme/copper-type cytochrome/quinol oxidase subunit 4
MKNETMKKVFNYTMFGLCIIILVLPLAIFMWLDSDESLKDEVKNSFNHYFYLFDLGVK